MIINYRTRVAVGIRLRLVVLFSLDYLTTTYNMI